MNRKFGEFVARNLNYNDEFLSMEKPYFYYYGGGGVWQSPFFPLSLDIESQTPQTNCIFVNHPKGGSTSVGEETLHYACFRQSQCVYLYIYLHNIPHYIGCKLFSKGEPLV